MASMKVTRIYRRLLREAGGIDPVFARLHSGETVGQIAASLQVLRQFLSKALNRDKARLAEIRGTRDTGGSGRLMPEQLEARIVRRLEAVEKLKAMIDEREAWLNGAKRLLAEKIAEIEFWRSQTRKGKPVRPNRWQAAELQEALDAKFKDPTPEDLAPAPAPMWDESTAAVEPKPAAEQQSDAEPYTLTVRSMADDQSIIRVIRLDAEPARREPAPPHAASNWFRTNSDPLAAATSSGKILPPPYPYQENARMSATRLLEKPEKKSESRRRRKQGELRVVRLDK